MTTTWNFDICQLCQRRIKKNVGKILRFRIFKRLGIEKHISSNISMTRLGAINERNASERALMCSLFCRDFSPLPQLPFEKTFNFFSPSAKKKPRDIFLLSLLVSPGIKIQRRKKAEIWTRREAEAGRSNNKQKTGGNNTLPLESWKFLTELTTNDGVDDDGRPCIVLKRK